MFIYWSYACTCLVPDMTVKTHKARYDLQPHPRHANNQSKFPCGPSWNLHPLMLMGDRVVQVGGYRYRYGMGILSYCCMGLWVSCAISDMPDKFKEPITTSYHTLDVLIYYPDV